MAALRAPKVTVFNILDTLGLLTLSTLSSLAISALKLYLRPGPKFGNFLLNAHGHLHGRLAVYSSSRPVFELGYTKHLQPIL